MNGSRQLEEEAIGREIEAAMERLERLESREEKERRRRRVAEEVWGIVTPEDRERFQREFMAEAFRMCDPESQAVLRQFATAFPLAESQDSLRKELTDARDRAARISSTLKRQTGKAPRIKRPRRREECSRSSRWRRRSRFRVTLSTRCATPEKSRESSACRPARRKTKPGVRTL